MYSYLRWPHWIDLVVFCTFRTLQGTVLAEKWSKRELLIIFIQSKLKRNLQYR